MTLSFSASSMPSEATSFDLVFDHVPVLAQELITGLALQPEGYYLDATVGGGGHSQLILDTLPDVCVMAIDRDGEALQAARDRLKNQYGERIRFWQGNFMDYPARVQEFDGIIADLGVSSPQLDRGERGFSFRLEAPLDMRMDQAQTLTAATVINHWTEVDLSNLFFEYGEERLSRRIARQIVQHPANALADDSGHVVEVRRRDDGADHLALLVVARLVLGVAREGLDLPAERAANPAFLDRRRDAIHVVIHVDERCRAGSEHFGNGQPSGNLVITTSWPG